MKSMASAPSSASSSANRSVSNAAANTRQLCRAVLQRHPGVYLPLVYGDADQGIALRHLAGWLRLAPEVMLLGVNTSDCRAEWLIIRKALYLP